MTKIIINYNILIINSYDKIIKHQRLNELILFPLNSKLDNKFYLFFYKKKYHLNSIFFIEKLLTYLIGQIKIH